jgi:hypothetical protein
MVTGPYGKCTAEASLADFDLQELEAFFTRRLAIAVLPLQTGLYPGIGARLIERCSTSLLKLSL